MKKKLFSSIFLLTISFYLTVTSCRTDSQHINNKPVRLIKNYTFNKKSSIISRIKTAPENVLKHLRDMDSRIDYTSYLPDKREMKLIKKHLRDIPPLHKKVLKERLLGIYFINHLWGSGLTDWIIDDNDNIYVYMAFNTAVIKKNFSELVTSKEKSCFIFDDPSLDVSIDCGKKNNGFLYILLHESTHAVDYVKRINKYIEPAVKDIQKKITSEVDFSDKIWKEMSKTYTEYPFRKNVTFYGFGKGPKIKISNSIKVYTQLSDSPFPSLYACLNWTEDLAELLTFYHYTEKMKQKFIIKVLDNGKIIYTCEPMKFPEVRKRFHLMKYFYQASP